MVVVIKSISVRLLEIQKYDAMSLDIAVIIIIKEKSIMTNTYEVKTNFDCRSCKFMYEKLHNSKYCNCSSECNKLFSFIFDF